VGDLRAPPADGDDLLDRCIIAARRDGAAMEPRALPPDARDAVEEAMSAADPGAELMIGLLCPACGSAWEDVLDPALFVWVATEDTARHLVADVAELASAFGWSEHEILALPATRRRLYLEAVRAW
jgi:hypothetical protein